MSGDVKRWHIILVVLGSNEGCLGTGNKFTSCMLLRWLKIVLYVEIFTKPSPLLCKNWKKNKKTSQIWPWSQLCDRLVSHIWETDCEHMFGSCELKNLSRTGIQMLYIYSFGSLSKIRIDSIPNIISLSFCYFHFPTSLDLW